MCESMLLRACCKICIASVCVCAVLYLFLCLRCCVVVIAFDVDSLVTNSLVTDILVTNSLQPETREKPPETSEIPPAPTSLTHPTPPTDLYHLTDPTFRCSRVCAALVFQIVPLTLSVQTLCVTIIVVVVTLISRQ